MKNNSKDSYGPPDPGTVPSDETEKLCELHDQRRWSDHPCRNMCWKFLLLETLHKVVYQKDIEEEFQIRKSTATGMLQLLEKNGFIVRESEKKDARLKRIIPTKKAEALRPSILAHIRQSETQLTTDISEADVLTCKKVLCQMLYNVSEHKEVCKKNE